MSKRLFDIFEKWLVNHDTIIVFNFKTKKSRVV